MNSYIVDKGQPPTLCWSFEMEMDDSDGTNFIQANKPGGPTSRWSHIAAVYQPGVAQTIYVDGVSFVSAAPPATMNQTSAQMDIGMHTSGEIIRTSTRHTERYDDVWPIRIDNRTHLPPSRAPLDFRTSPERHC